ncbi:MAG: TrkH family potassium uptake protein [Bacteroidales bacterium]
MINYRIIARVFSILIVLEGALMMLSALISYILGEDVAGSFLKSGIITIIIGILVFTPLKSDEKLTGNREGYIIVSGIWILLAIFGTLPYLFSGSIKNFIDAFFESMSGFTTTGATIINDVESLPKGILLWRSLTQWIGGMGIIFLSLYVLPILKDLTIPLSTNDFSGQSAGKIHPRAVDAAKRMIGSYVLLTFVEAAILSIAGMPVFDSVCQSFSTLSSGGFSVYNNSLSIVSSPFMKVVFTFFMFFSATNMAVIYYTIKGNFTRIRENSEFIFYFIICLVFITAIAASLVALHSWPAGTAILDSAFHVISVISTTGFYTSDYTLWGSFALLLIFILMFTGGTAGSASGGVKIARLMIMTRNNRMELRRLIHPNAYIPVRLNGKIVQQNIVYNILVFVTLYFIVICISALAISLLGYDIMTSFGTAASMLGNIGPGLGELGPFHTYADLPHAGKVFLSMLMYLGRLEMMSVLILFSRSFYRR